ncbi:N-acetylneuraminate synthase [Shewanella eurypsychrophilus]|uniref:N-acetylneuraminate synthase n=1 Tax=Shewanella eurypsychrophilus TaxID=2593656 RepID=A0ABX6VA96_9GAMM|nr:MULTISPECIES: N-acetylneuraminate synthase [Shewanella]QFU23529.1 N-acetylneuraminate synthase [Shewanella sp. YLB-09]QPG58755.1 N-acetylneuraminate synthase [Shewanella eurypsychrophilus]
MNSDKVFIIAEAGVNHNGSLQLAKELVDAAVESGVDAVKFQTWKTELVVTQDVGKAEYQVRTTTGKNTQFDMLSKLELPFNDFRELKSYCDSKKIMFLSTADEEVSATFLLELQNIFKIGSGELTNLPFLRFIGALKKKVILSTGMGNLGEVESALKVLIDAGTTKEDITVLHVTTQYPTPMSEVNLKAMNTIQGAFDVRVGYSDHTMGIEVPIAAVALGARIIEKHFTLSRKMEGPDHQASLEPSELAQMVCAIRNIELALGNGIKQIQDCEQQNKKVVQKFIVAIKPIMAGEAFTIDNIAVKRASSGLEAKYWNLVIGRQSDQVYSTDQSIAI